MKWIARIAIFSIAFSPLFASANLLDPARDDELLYKDCLTFMPVAVGLTGGLVGGIVSGGVAAPVLGVVGTQLGVIGCDVFHKKFDWVETANRANNAVFGNITRLTGMVNPGFPLLYPAYKLLTGGMDVLTRDFEENTMVIGSRTMPVPESQTASSDATLDAPPSNISKVSPSEPKAQAASEVPTVTKGGITARVLSPDGQPVSQAKFSLADSQGKNPDVQYQFRLTDAGALNVPLVPGGRYTLYIECGAHCMFGKEFATGIVDDIYAKWSAEMEITVDKAEVSLGTITLKKWTKVFFKVVNDTGQSSPFFRIEFFDSQGRKVERMTMSSMNSGSEAHLPDGTYTLTVDARPQYVLFEKEITLSGGEMKLGTLTLEKP